MIIGISNSSKLRADYLEKKSLVTELLTSLKLEKFAHHYQYIESDQLFNASGWSEFFLKNVFRNMNTVEIRFQRLGEHSVSQPFGN